MSISLSGRQRDRFKADLQAHRETFSLNDGEYADQVLKVSLNTYKKCVQANGPLALKRHTFVNIFANTALDPRNYGLAIGVPSQVSPFGGYQKNDYKFLCGRFFLYRRSFLTARHITRSILDIRPSESHECLSFTELHYYTSEVGAREESRYHGDVYMNQERSILSLPAYSQGQVRLTHLQPERLGAKRQDKDARCGVGLRKSQRLLATDGILRLRRRPDRGERLASPGHLQDYRGRFGGVCCAFRRACADRRTRYHHYTAHVGQDCGQTCTCLTDGYQWIASQGSP